MARLWSLFALMLAAVAVVPSESSPVHQVVPNELYEQTYKTCGSASDLGEVQKVFFTPENPQSGKPLVITTTTLFKARVEAGATIKVTAKLGPIPVRTDNYNLCDFVNCPIEPGTHTYSITTNIPPGTPPLRLTYRSVGLTVDGQQMTCVEGALQITNP
jgi:hypothetical protein